MPKSLTLSGPMKLSAHGKRLVAESMYAKGKAFLGAAMLLRQKGGYEYVVLHLLCQGIEVVLKAVLFAIDYDVYQPKLKKYHHDLIKVTDAATAAGGLPPLSPMRRSELQALSNLYSRHLLRYASGYDILVDPSTISSRRTLRRLAAVLRFIDRKGLFVQAVSRPPLGPP